MPELSSEWPELSTYQEHDISDGREYLKYTNRALGAYCTSTNKYKINTNYNKTLCIHWKFNIVYNKNRIKNSKKMVSKLHFTLFAMSSVVQIKKQTINNCINFNLTMT